MAACKLTYFNFTGYGEPIRFLLSYAEIDFIDERIDKEDWPKIKPTTPFGQVPVLEIDGKKVNQSTAICRYLAKKCDLYGKDDWEALEIDATLDTIHDVRIKAAGCFQEKNASKKAENIRSAKEVIPSYVERLDAQVDKNGGYFVGGRLSFVDVVFASFIDCLSFMAGFDIIEKAENLKSLKKRALEEPKIKEYVAKRPETPM